MDPPAEPAISKWFGSTDPGVGVVPQGAGGREAPPTRISDIINKDCLIMVGAMPFRGYRDVAWGESSSTARGETPDWRPSYRSG